MGPSPAVPHAQWSCSQMRSETRGRTANFQKPCSILGTVSEGDWLRAVWVGLEVGWGMVRQTWESVLRWAL